MTKKTYDEYDTYTQTKRIADALEEILRLVKADQEEAKKRWPNVEEKNDE
jgi:hypothetical protein